MTLGDPRKFNPGGPVSPGRPIRLECGEKEAFVPLGRDPHARVAKAGRWIYRIIIIDDVAWSRTAAGPWIVWGRARAMRKAERKLLTYLRDNARADHPIVIRPENAGDLKRRFLEAQARPEPYEIVSEPRDTGDRWGIWPLLILIAVCLGGVAFGRWVQ